MPRIALNINANGHRILDFNDALGKPVQIVVREDLVMPEFVQGKLITPSADLRKGTLEVRAPHGLTLDRELLGELLPYLDAFERFGTAEPAMGRA